MKRNPSAFPLVVLSVLVLLVSSCNNQTLRIFKSSSARTQYLSTLENSGIAATKIGEEWHSAAGKAILNAADLEIPIAIQGSFKSKSIEAKAWRFQLEQGASITILVQWQAKDSSELIVDLLDGPAWEELKSYAIQNDSVKFEAEKTGGYLLRIQPELLGEGNFQVRIYGTATYAVFPVQGKNSRAIQSVWGDARDAGRRSHEGVDIFAARGTPVLAPVDGVVTAVRNRGLGGKQVWVRDRERNWNLYFAHLDSQLVSNLQRVNPGDTLGLVGNSGNARTTAPHLHFGIYQHGAINPYPAIQTEFEVVSELPEREFPPVMKVNVSQANLRRLPTTKSEVISKLDANALVYVSAATFDWVQVQTVEGINGYLSQSLLSQPEASPMASSTVYAYTSPNPFVLDSLLIQLENFSKLGSAQEYEMIQDRDENLLFLKRGNF
ncbi:peptidoglycan DD-metalloendopeptidase family protein [Algoriphagus resistens]|uniref:peptidoglycan DD-metalloendopeptidase family protein n=1 Tax=Algoriphagus resistens TaxID=1750590 RepID=UPI000716A5C9|nr:peptidoglycan DD-metalloendopeptidase family protein [Algoriphagus resistens]